MTCAPPLNGIFTGVSLNLPQAGGKVGTHVPIQCGTTSASFYWSKPMTGIPDSGEERQGTPQPAPDLGSWFASELYIVPWESLSIAGHDASPVRTLIDSVVRLTFSEHLLLPDTPCGPECVSVCQTE